MKTLSLEERRSRIETIVKILGLLLIGFLVAPFILATIKGLVGMAVAGFIGLLLWNLTPSVAHLIANWRLKALKAVAAANPIETLENQYAAKESALVKIRDNIKEFHTVVADLWQQIQEHKQAYPNRPSQYLERYQKLKALLELRSNKYKQAQKNLKAFAELIEEKRSDWKIAQITAKASRLANVGEDFQNKLLQDTALTTIQDGLNYAFSELEVSLLDEQGEAAAGTVISTTVTVAPAAIPTPIAALAEKAGPPTLDLDFVELHDLNEEKQVLARRK